MSWTRVLPWVVAAGFLAGTPLFGTDRTVGPDRCATCANENCSGPGCSGTHDVSGECKHPLLEEPLPNKKCTAVG